MTMGGANQLLDWLFWQSIYASIAAAAIFILIKLLRVRDPRWLMGLWTIVLLRFLLPTDLAMPWGLGALWDQLGPGHGGGGGGGEGVAPIASVGSSSVLPMSAVPPAFLLALIWGMGVLGLSALMLRQQLRMRGLLRSAVSAPPDAQRRLDHWRRIFGIGRGVRFVVGDERLLPFTTGLFSPVIFMSRRHLEAMAPDALDAVLVHELAHVRSWDVTWLCLERIVQLLFFFHPVAWWATGRLSQARERCCDIQAVKRSEMKAGHYWESVLALLGGNADAPPRLAIARSLGQSARSLKDRIEAVHFHSRPHPGSRLAACLGLAALGLFLLPMAPVARTALISAPAAEADVVSARASVRKGAEDRVVQARATLERYRRGDFGDRVIIRPDGKTLCAPGSWPRGVTCAGMFSRKDIKQLVWEAEDNLEKAERAAAGPQQP